MRGLIIAKFNEAIKATGCEKFAKIYAIITIIKLTLGTDLYKINGGEVRRLKGSFYYEDFRNMDDYNKFLNSYNDLFNKVKEFLKEYKLVEFEVKIEKLYDINVREYKLMKNKGYIGNFEDYKKDKYNNERVLILSIRWKY